MIRSSIFDRLYFIPDLLNSYTPMIRFRKYLIASVFIILPLLLVAQPQSKFSYLDVFDLQYVSDPQISPDGAWVVYRKMGFDIMKDRAAGNLWLVRTDGSSNQKLTTREGSESSPRWSPNGDQIAFISLRKRAQRFIFTGKAVAIWPVFPNSR